MFLGVFGAPPPIPYSESHGNDVKDFWKKETSWNRAKITCDRYPFEDGGLGRVPHCPPASYLPSLMNTESRMRSSWRHTFKEFRAIYPGEFLRKKGQVAQRQSPRVAVLLTGAKNTVYLSQQCLINYALKIIARSGALRGLSALRCTLHSPRGAPRDLATKYVFLESQH